MQIYLKITVKAAIKIYYVFNYKYTFCSLLKLHFPCGNYYLFHVSKIEIYLHSNIFFRLIWKIGKFRKKFNYFIKEKNILRKFLYVFPHGIFWGAFMHSTCDNSNLNFMKYNFTVDSK